MDDLEKLKGLVAQGLTWDESIEMLGGIDTLDSTARIWLLGLDLGYARKLKELSSAEQIFVWKELERRLPNASTPRIVAIFECFVSEPDPIILLMTGYLEKPHGYERYN